MRFRNSTTKLWVWLFFAFWIFFFAIFWSKAVFYDAEGNFVAGHVNIWGDWAAHFTMATAMFQRGPFISSPLLIGEKFNYPFVADFISAILMHAGLPLQMSFILPSFLLSIFFIFSLYIFFFTIWKSAKMAIISSCIFLLNGGIGFVIFLQDILQSPQPLATLLHPAHEYTRIDQLGIKWISVIDSMMIPQRAFLLGFPIALLCLAGIIHAQSIRSLRYQLLMHFLIGVLIGTLPIIHTHSFLALFIILGCWSIIDMLTHRPHWPQVWARWAAVVTGVSIFAFPLLAYYYLGAIGQHFFTWYPGWLANEYHVPWLLFWWRNWGITPIVAFVGWILLFQSARHAKYSTHRTLSLTQPLTPWLFFPFWLLFVLINLFLFQPFAWDNTKLLVWASVGIAGLATYMLATLWRWGKRALLHGKIFAIGLAGIFFFAMTLSGAIDTYRLLLFPLHSYTMYSATELRLTDWVLHNTPVDSLWLTGNQHNHWLFNLTGRQTIMAYPGWLWTYGYVYWPVERDVRDMYDGEIVGKQLLKKYHVDYVIIGPGERTTFYPNEEAFDQSYHVVYQLGLTKIYKVN